jgi:hypothetical protein
MEGEVVLTQEEARGLYSLLASLRPQDEVLRRLLLRIESHLYRTLTIEEIERLQGEPGRGGEPRGPR